MLRMVLMVLQVFSSVAIIALVLLQRGKGAEAGAGFGAGASGTVFGARGARTALSRATAIFAAIFMLNSLALAYMGNRAPTEQPKSILDDAGETAPATSSPPPVVPTPAVPTVPAPSAGSVPAPAGGTPAPQ
jgi:preprotein translocase subunit SecG